LPDLFEQEPNRSSGDKRQKTMYHITKSFRRRPCTTHCQAHLDPFNGKKEEEKITKHISNLTGVA
jgi:hypothetical protein